MGLIASKAPETQGRDSTIHRSSDLVIKPEDVTWLFLFKFKPRLLQPRLL